MEGDSAGRSPGVADAGVVDFRLIRHGESSSCEADGGLTGRGRGQVLEKGRALADELLPGGVIRLVHAPTARAAETATVLREALLRERLDVGAVYPDALFGNFSVWCDGHALDPAELSSAHRRVRDRAPTAPWPPWFDEVDRYLALRRGEGSADPVGFWLTVPLQHFEPAASTVRRLWRGIRRTARRTPRGSRVLVSTHSGCLRALVAAAFGADPGEPGHLEDVRVRWRGLGRRAGVSYRGRTVDVAPPDRTVPPWCTDRWPGRGGEGASADVGGRSG